jgi:RNA polymerase sigma-70 factor (ECF subfamily)
MIDWPQIVEQHGPLVWRTLRRFLNQDADLADGFQRTFVSALQVAEKQSVRNWPGLLKRLATVRALEAIRQTRRKSGQVAPLQERSAIDRGSASPVQAAEAAELAEHLREALATLDEKQAEVFCLACLDDLSYQEIADQLGITVNYVGVLLSRARARLQQLLLAHHPGAEQLQGKAKP